jgi:hypothetical protein
LPSFHSKLSEISSQPPFHHDVSGLSCYNPPRLSIVSFDETCTVRCWTQRRVVKPRLNIRENQSVNT